MASRETAAANDERTIIEDYMKEHRLEVSLNDAVNAVVKDRPSDPFVELSALMAKVSANANVVLGVAAQEIMGGGGTPALEVTVTTAKGAFTASTASGPYDNDATRHRGKGLKKSAEAVRALVKEKLVGSPLSVDAVDAALLALAADTGLPPNAVLATSVACCKAAAAHAGQAAYQHIAELAGVPEPTVPVPVLAVINGGDHGSTKMPLAEVAVMPITATTFKEALDMGAAVHAMVPGALAELGLKNANLGSRGGWVPTTPADDATDCLQAVATAAERADMARGVRLCVDVGAPRMAEVPKTDEDSAAAAETQAAAAASLITHYNVSKWNKDAIMATFKSSEDLTEMYLEWLGRFQICSIEDAFDVKDSSAFMRFKERVDQALQDAAMPVDGDGDDGELQIQLTPVGGDEACMLQLVGDEVCATSDDVVAWDEQKAVNTLSLSLAKGGTVTGCIELCQKAQSLAWGVCCASDKAGETDDTFLAHLAVGLRAGQIKAGGLGTLECASTYNELLRISERDDAPPYAAEAFRGAPAGEV